MTFSNKQVWIYIFLAFIFSVACRLIWVYQFSGVESFYWNNQFMINTNDGYFYAEGARDILAGFHQPNDLSPMSTAPSQLTAFFASILPFSFESIIFFMPAILSSLIVIPLILIARELKLLHVGFIAALFGSIVWSYYNRTMIGYYDTDMLNIVFPTFLLWSLVLALHSRAPKYLLFTALEIIAYRWWYPQSYSLEFAFFGLILLYTIVFERKNIYLYKLVALMLLAMMNIPSLIKFFIVIIVYFIYKKEQFNKYIYYFLGVTFLLFFFTGGFSPIWAQLKGYVFDKSVEAQSTGLNLHFFTVMQTVREAGKIPFEIFANRISGNVITFLLSIIGYIWLSVRNPVMLLGLPMIGLGFLAYVGGLRFTIYAIPPLALGIAFLIYSIAQYMNHKSIKYTFYFVAVLGILYPNITHILGYKVPTVFSKQEVRVLDKLKHIASREDYVISWWDYGYPIRYYSDVKTLIDGGKHSGSVNFPVSYMLTHSQEVGAKLARYDVEYTEKRFEANVTSQKLASSNIEQMTLDAGYKNTNDFLEALNVENKVPKKTRDIYFYLPYRMLSVLPAIIQFSNLDLMSGKIIENPFFYQTARFEDDKQTLNLDNGIILDKQNGILHLGEQQVPVKTFYFTQNDTSGKLIRQKQELHPNAPLSIIFMQSYGTFLVVDEQMLHSLFIQLFVFENYDKRYFEPMILNPNAKVYKLKF
jgi:dolichyl-diphosphooligosaccharide--protein glycosyltransferase/undecaprenyl-diphosphooligosaccharide--protein glycosyltransferase